MDFDEKFDLPRFEQAQKTNGAKRRLSTNQLSSMADHRNIIGFTVNLPENDDQLERKKKRVEHRLSSMCSPTTAMRNVTPNRMNDSPSLDRIHQSFPTPPPLLQPPPPPSRTLSNEQLKEIYTNCIQLSNENKISAKNAFGLMLLDHIQDLLSSSSQKKAGEGINLNFQVAGCTLDAGVKIYSYRVDRIHSDAYKVNGCFHVGSDKSPSGDESAKDEPENMDGLDEGQIRKNTIPESVKDNKKRMMQKQGCKIERNVKNINLDSNSFHTDVSDPWDEVFASRPIGNFESNNVAGLFLLNLSVSEDGGFVDSTIQRPLFTPTVSSDRINKEVDLCHIENFTKSISHLMERFSGLPTADPSVKDESSNLQNICNVLDSFSFEKWSPPSKEQLMSGNDLEVNMLECITGCANSSLASTDARSKLNRSLNISIDNPISNSLLNAQNNQYDENYDGAISDDGSSDEHPQMLDDLQTNFFQSPPNPDLKLPTSNKTLDGVSLLSTSTVPVNMTGGMCLELSIEPSEYSFFTAAMNAGSTVGSMDGGSRKINQFMVGPEHWKLSTIRPKNLDDRRKGNDRKLLNRQKGISDETELKETVFKTHSFLDPLSEERLESLKTISNASKHTLSKTLIGNVNSTNAYGSGTTFLDRNDACSILDKSESILQKFNKPAAFSTERFFKLFLMPNIRIKPSSNATCTGGDENILFANEDSIFCREEDGLDIRNDEDLGYNMENLNDTLNYCPDISSLGDDDEVVANHVGAECSMVPEPKHKISKLEIAYSKLAKRIDAKHLKSSIWSTLVDPEIIAFPPSSSADNNSSDKLSDEPIVKKTKIDLNTKSNVKSFSDMYERLPKKLSFTSRKNLSVPIAFVCLLHLANEKSLDLTNMDDLKDILIKLPPDSIAPPLLDE